jgi:putative FmdB family regulatory protein
MNQIEAPIGETEGSRAHREGAPEGIRIREETVECRHPRSTVNFKVTAKRRFDHEEDMPLYEYRCEACGASEEKLEGISAPDRHDCPACGGSDGMRRQVSVAAFALSGSGWYAQGYGKEGAAKTAEKGEVAPAKPATGGCCGGCACH